MEARGFIYAAPVALALGAGFVPVRKPGKLPRATLAETYALEYGEDTLEIHARRLRAGCPGPGGRRRARHRRHRWPRRSGWSSRRAAWSHGVAVLIELGFLPGRRHLGDVPLTSLLTI